MDRTFFVTSVTAQRRTVFQRDPACDLLVDVLQHYRRQGKYLLHDFVFMPDHIHILITPAPEISLEKAVQFIKGGFSFRLKSKISVWQPSFTNHRIRDSEDFDRHREYIRMNPVRAGLVGKVEDYPYSSASGKFKLDPMSNAGLKAGSSTKTFHRDLPRVRALGLGCAGAPLTARFAMSGIPRLCPS
jgi:putative transposase